MITGITFKRASTQKPLILNDRIAGGGEGVIYTVDGITDIVAKIYKEPTPLRASKLQVMLANPPTDPMRPSHISIAWPNDAILNAWGNCIGFLMPYIDPKRTIKLAKLYNPLDRQKTIPTFNWQYLLRTASNLACTLEALHKANYVVGDLNESNVLVSRSALVTLVDCDSMQVPYPGGVFRCSVGKPEYTPPELQGKNFSQFDRTPHQDTFGLAVLIFLLLMEGSHPFQQVWHGTGTPPSLQEHIQAGRFPYAGMLGHEPPPQALPWTTLPLLVRDLLLRCFVDGYRDPTLRPTAGEWHRVLSEVEKQLVQCHRNEQHWYGGHLETCPWCERARYMVFDPFPEPNQQISLAPVGRKNTSGQYGRIPIGNGLPSSTKAQPLSISPMQTVRQPTPSQSMGRVSRASAIKAKAALLGVVLLVIVVSCGLLFNLVQGAINHATASATASAATAGASYATSIAKYAPIATAQAVAETATITAISNDPYAPGEGKLALYDALNENSSLELNGCPGQNTGNAFHIQTAVGVGWRCVYSSPDFSNFVYEIRMVIIKGDCGGEIFRLNQDESSFYDFTVCRNGTYHLNKIILAGNGTPDVGYKLIQTTFSSAILQGFSQINVIAIKANGETFTLYINKQLIAIYTDTNQPYYSHGIIGILADDSTTEADVAYSNLIVWTL